MQDTASTPKVSSVKLTKRDRQDIVHIMGIAELKARHHNIKRLCDVLDKALIHGDRSGKPIADKIRTALSEHDDMTGSAFIGAALTRLFNFVM